MADNAKGKTSGSQGAKSRDWYDAEKKKAPAGDKGGTSDTPQAEHPLKRELSAAMERHATERDDMHKRQREEVNGLLDRDDLVAAQVPVKGDESMA
jgi:hypothetical protein